MSAELLDRARAGDGEAFRQVAEPHRRELQLHCYRMLGSLQDAEDALQDTLLAAWRGLTAFEGRSSLRTWLYQVATNRCLNILRANRRRPVVNPLPPGVEVPEPSRTGEAIWLDPYPDALLGGPNEPPGPDARYEASEAISIAFLTALQALSARQRAVLILRDVLGYRAREVATILDASEESITSALKRARAVVQQRLAATAEHEPPPRRGSPEERELVDRLTRAYESGDLDALVALLVDDVAVTMPPMPLEYHGIEHAARFFAAITFRDGRTFRLIATRANGQPAFGTYVRDPRGGPLHATGLVVVTLAGDRVSALTRFDASVLTRLDLPLSLAD
ncbi:MAG TPA: RNA polymerase subunit sigma-70 [Acidimicrobiales bacterium]|nr:RNA polymerase subunit sigma-70 [Acidimicrobiales bacterium]